MLADASDHSITWRTPFTWRTHLGSDIKRPSWLACSSPIYSLLWW